MQCRAAPFEIWSIATPRPARPPLGGPPAGQRTREAEDARLVVARLAREKRPGLEVPLEDEFRSGPLVLPDLRGAISSYR